MPDGCGETAEIDLFACLCVVEISCRAHRGGWIRRERFALFHPRLEGIERTQSGIDAESKRGTLRAGDCIAENAETAPTAFDGIEQQGRRRLRRCRHFGDGADLETR